MTRSVLGLGAMFVGLGLLTTACAGESASEDNASSEEAFSENVAPATPGGFHAMPLMSASKSAVAPAAATRLKYYGGPVLPNVKIFAVYWGASTAFQTHLNDFYGSITSSAYFDWLTEYNTPTQTIGHGSFLGSKVITPSVTGTRLKDAQIQAEINAQIDAGNLPEPDGVNTLYMLHFPPRISITAPDGSSQSCVQFCAYHGTFKRGEKLVFYGIHPDLAQSGCSGGCGMGSAQDNTTSVASHELVEAVTDAAVGLATEFGPPLAWYNEQKGEIGDICNGRQGRVAGFTVQTQWSNAKQACIVQ
jgi:hypothetical protein